MTHRKTVLVLVTMGVAASMLATYTFAQPAGDGRGQGGPPQGQFGPGQMGPGGGPMGPGRQRPRFGQEQAERMGLMLNLIERMERTCFEEGRAGLIAIGGLKDDVRRDSREIIDDLEDQLARTKTLGLRNAIRLTLKDLYKTQGDDEKVLRHLRAMLAENDEALQKAEDDDDDEDDDD